MSATPTPASTIAARMPTGFVAHGAPTLAIDPVKGADLTRWSEQLPKPRALLIISAHWEQAPVTIGTLRSGHLMYDFYGFPKPLYELTYDAPAATDLVARIEALLPGPIKREDRALDHGVWVPLLHMYPEHDIPVLQLSMPTSQGHEALVELGRRLSPLRDEGVLILGSGNLVHNLRRIDFQQGAPPAWAKEFDQWVKERMLAKDLDALMDVVDKGPATRLAHPSLDHYLPLLIIAGASDLAKDSLSFPLEGFEFGSISRRCVMWSAHI